MKEKIGLSTTEWILSIAGIVLLSCLIILPPVFRTFLKEEKKEEYIPKGVEIKTLKCTKNNYYSGVVRKNDTYTIKYYKDKVKTYNIKLESIYTDTVPYDEEKQKEGRLSTAYNLVEGISYTVNPNDAALKITTEEECDLSVFKATTVKLPGDEIETRINSVYTPQDSVDQIKRDLQSEGYICE